MIEAFRSFSSSAGIKIVKKKVHEESQNRTQSLGSNQLCLGKSKKALPQYPETMSNVLRFAFISGIVF